MQTVTVTLPNAIKHTLEKQVEAGMFPSLADAIRVGASLLAKSIDHGDDERWVTTRLIRKVKKAEKEPVDSARMWHGKGSFTDFVLNKS